MEELYLRAATIEDLPVLYEFEQGIITAERPYDDTIKPDPINYYDLKAIIESDESEVIIAVIGEEIVGSSSVIIKAARLYLKHTHYAHLGFMYVKPTHRGKGINKRIMAALTLWAQSKNIKELQLNVYSDNASAIKAYEKAGFKSHMINMRLAIE